jgi:tetratricopeptide (TPR) repeat protein
LNRGNVRRTMHDAAGAMDDYDRAIALDPKSGIAYFDRGVLRAEGGQYSLARTDFKRALQIGPAEADSDFKTRAAAYLQQLPNK